LIPESYNCARFTRTLFAALPQEVQKKRLYSDNTHTHQ